MNDLTVTTHKTPQNSLKKAETLLSIANKLTIKTLIFDSKNIKPTASLTTFIGIDFGTSTTVVSIASSDSLLENIKSNPIELNQKLSDGAIYKSYKIPTMVAWYNESLIIGEGANQLKHKLKQGKNLWHSFKMELGEDVGAKYAESELNNEKIKILNPKDVTTLFFKYLKTQIEKYVKENNLPTKIEYAVSIPASFEANQRKDLIDSLHANNMMLEKQALIDEPNAAFLSCISSDDLKNEIYISEEYPTNILVFDFGAGTCDISILEIANSPKGYYSKNVAISRFEALGGNDIDKKIAKDVLFMQFLKENSIEEKTFKRKEVEIILARLEKAAEILKIEVSKQFDLLKNNLDFEEIIYSEEIVQINYRVEIKSANGAYEMKTPKISYCEFTAIIDSFTQIDIENLGDSNVKNIFIPIRSALEKAQLFSEDIDYVLFIGGSTKNPLIQRALKKYFDKSEYLIPSDLQVHVSSGAAIHSLMFNGYEKNLINPITSEPILAIVKDEKRDTTKTLLKAGTQIPCSAVIIDNLRPQRDQQNIIEIPLYIGNTSKLLHNIKIEAKTANGFSKNTDVKIYLTINADKVLLVKATIDNKEIVEIEPLNPFSNRTTTHKDRLKFQAEKEYNNALAANFGKTPVEALKKLSQEYERLECELEAAEVLQELYEKFNHGNLNNIGVAYSNAGDDEKAMMFYEKAFEKDPSEITAFNIALKYKHKDSAKYKEWLLKSLEIDEHYNGSLYLYGVYLVNNGEDKKGLERIHKAFNSWMHEYQNNMPLSTDISWFIACARYLEKYDLVAKLEKSDEDLQMTHGEFNSENLTSIRRRK